VIAALERIAGTLETCRPRAGAPELPLAVPESVEQAAELLRLAAVDGLTVIPVGRGSKLGWCGPPAHADFMLGTRRLAEIVAHEPDDGTITARAGIGMDALREAARAGGHFLTPDVPRPADATLGGVLAAGQSGLDRLRFGPVRHHVLGMTVLLGDGTTARSGGRLVKNVTGFDLHRLYCGSRGSLCVIVEASLRLFPEPERELLLTTAAADTEAAARLAAEALALPARTVSLIAERDAAGWRLTARLFGKREAVAAEREPFLRAWPAAEIAADAAAREAAERTRDTALESAGGVLEIGCRPTEVWQALAAVDEAFAAPRVRLQPGIALLEISLGAADAGIAPTCERLRAKLATACTGGASVRLVDGPLHVFEPPVPAAAALMERLQRSLDPRGVFARGRLGGGL